MTGRRAVVVCGNPKPSSKTLAIAEHVATRIVALGTPNVTCDVIDLAEHARELFDWSSTAVGQAVDTVKSADVAVVASPVYKACFTGLLKAFLDRIGAGDLDGTVAVPLMVGGAPQHALAVEVHLRPVLVELGATCVTPGLFVLESAIPQLDGMLDLWLERRGVLAAVAAVLT